MYINRTIYQFNNGYDPKQEYLTSSLCYHSRMKKITAALALTFLLAACGGGDATIACEETYWDGTVGTCLPAGWHALDRAELDDRGVPTEVVAAFQANTPTSGQFATVTVTREALSQPLTSSDYSEASVQSVIGLPNYDEVDKQDITIDDTDVTLHIFTAQPDPEEPEARFYQVSAALGNTGYTYTAATPVTVSNELEEEVLVIVRSATLRGPNATEE